MHDVANVVRHGMGVRGDSDKGAVVAIALSPFSPLSGCFVFGHHPVTVLLTLMLVAFGH
jgi:hypothetical protein